MKDTQELVERAIEIHLEIEKAKLLYRELDVITDRLLQTGRKKFRFGNYSVSLKDNFERKNTVFRPAAVRHFEIQFEVRVRGVKRAA